MDDKKCFDRSNSTLNRLEGSILLGTGKHPKLSVHQVHTRDLEHKPDSKLHVLLKKLGWVLAYAGFLSALLSWGLNSRFGLLILLLLR
ncbi:hypothetical protein IF690_20480 [Pseudomonas sp. SK3(2021)]|uniref:hypothetical protein n=1 Tax=Pseudomonas sp. SK3(2021) TaxID=2841064 RepID=UPI00192C5522|nr:hypothetical protein [Pseudomonas sp. SK3(2021)]QQZ40380.1 hypothetical protein IF690_20480 [Pseudomonas sp. SK3(2021)]